MGYLEKFNHHIQGNPQGPKLVFLHGLMGAAANWRKVASQLQEDYEILTFDQRGHGRSYHPKSGYEPADYAKDLKLILDELGWEKITLIGHSMGGRNAIQFGALYPEYLTKLVIEDIAPEGAKEGLARIRRLIDLVPTPFESKKAARDFFNNEFENKIKGDPQAHTLAQFFYTNIEVKETGQADWRFYKEGILSSAEEGRKLSLWEAYKGLSLPILVIRGAHSKELSPADYEKMLETNTQAKGIVVEDAGHWVHFDQPQMFLSAIKNFISSS